MDGKQNHIKVSAGLRAVTRAEVTELGRTQGREGTLHRPGGPATRPVWLKHTEQFRGSVQRRSEGLDPGSRCSTLDTAAAGRHWVFSVGEGLA